METQPSGYMSFLIKPESMVIWLVQTNLEGLVVTVENQGVGAQVT